MSDLPPIIHESTEWLVEEIGRLRLGKYAGRSKPHKLIMLLAVIDLAADGLLKVNRIYFDEPLLSRFEKYFVKYATEEDWNQPAPPFFHLRSSQFWFHRVKVGRERKYMRLRRAGGGTKRITENIEYAYLDDRAFMAVNEPAARKILYDCICQQLERLSDN